MAPQPYRTVTDEHGTYEVWCWMGEPLSDRLLIFAKAVQAKARRNREEDSDDRP